MQGIARAMFGTAEDRADFEAITTLRAAVQRQILCQTTGAVLDVRTAVYVSITDPASEARSALAVTGEAWDRAREQVLSVATDRGWTVEVTDGRHYTAKGTRRKAAPARSALAL